MINNNNELPKNELPKNEEIEEVEIDDEIEENEDEDEEDDYEISDEHFEFIESQKFELELAEARVSNLKELIKHNTNIAYDSTNNEELLTASEYAELMSGIEYGD